ncbi:hypothetical protein Saro_2186 [Novosphingobium aromaticivorans DSM 12444]|uniref:Uncharacterized protein n=1 Tax=Novosphingobium aromaticivorans (strain ATCC 700278 / DSM 12444 / CCUG 56034 / CIP 105152 / NBRC 16084 / F199) TaxID=279238 RepID=Q2G698_NOVAD|nr:hypothetical protein Saro_2186 [Novosphingobium aromaticivorans DSM 12444]
MFFCQLIQRFVAYGVPNCPQLRGQEPAIDPVTDDAFCDPHSKGPRQLADPRIAIGTDGIDAYVASNIPDRKEAPHGPGHTECDTERQRFPGNGHLPERGVDQFLRGFPDTGRSH